VVGAVVVGGEVEAPVDAVAAVLADPRSYERVVDGIRAIRWFDAHWPATGSRFHHTVGFGLVAVRDRAEVLAGELPDRLELALGLGPAGALRVELRLQASASGRATRVELAEEPSRGPVLRAWSTSVERFVRRRNGEIVRRLGALAAERARIQVLDSLDRDP
jgi:hypothetical protein